jgi:hypothetical protein
MKLSKLTIGFGIYLIVSASYMTQVWDFTNKIFGQDAVKIICFNLFFASIIAYFVFLYKSNAGLFKSLAGFLILLLTFYFAWLQSLYGEKMHVLEYGLLGFLAAKDLFKSRFALKALLYSLLFVILISSFDEIFQKLLPYRFGEIKDAVVNIISGIFGIILFLITKNNDTV